jgi:hypothetical protein
MLSDDPDTATVQTVQEMCRQINESANDPRVAAIAERAIQTFRGGPSGARLLWQGMQAHSCWWWCKWNLKFVHHGDQFEAWSSDLGDPQTKQQLLIAPDVLVRMKRMEGDCAIYTMMLCAMLKSLGLPYRIVTLAVDPHQPEIFTHVCASSNGEYLDASHGKYPGWRVPKEHTMKEWTFDESGQRVGGFTGLHDYRPSRFRRRRGIGADDSVDLGSLYPDTGQYSGLPPAEEWSPAYYNPTQVFGENLDWGVPRDSSTGGYTVPSQNSAQWAQFAAASLRAGLSLAQQQALKPGMVILPNGTILQQNPGYSVPVGNVLGSSISGSSSNILLYGGLALAGLFLAGSMFKGGR